MFKLMIAHSPEYSSFKRSGASTRDVKMDDCCWWGWHISVNLHVKGIEFSGLLELA